jgi:hypothetical protein
MFLACLTSPPPGDLGGMIECDVRNGSIYLFMRSMN